MAKWTTEDGVTVEHKGRNDRRAYKGNARARTEPRLPYCDASIYVDHPSNHGSASVWCMDQEDLYDLADCITEILDFVETQATKGDLR